MSASQNATFQNLTNTGATLVEGRNATFTAVTNTGLPLPHRDLLTQPQLGWGVAITPETVAIVVTEAAKATFYTYEGDVTFGG